MSATTGILKRLESAGFSQTEISRRTHIPQPTLSKWAAGRAAKAADAALRLRDMELAVLGDGEQDKPASVQEPAQGGHA